MNNILEQLPLRLLRVISPEAPGGDVLSHVVAQVAALAEGCQVGAVVVARVAVQVGYGEHYPGEPVEAEPVPGHSEC